MRAAVIYRYGPAYSFKLKEVPLPSVGENEVLVKVKASSVNPVDWKIRKGNLKFVSGLNFPKILGADFSGEITKVGSKVSSFKAGDQVYGMLNAVRGGAYAEYVVASEKSLTNKPNGISFEEAAAIPLAGMTALQGLRDYGHLKPEEKILINGASGGVGSYAVQIAVAMGARVTAVCSRKNIEMVKGLGASEVIDYTSEDVFGAGNKYHLIYDTHGNLAYRAARKSLYDGGVLVSSAPSPKAIIDLSLSLVSRQTKMKVFMLQASKNDLEDLRKLVEKGELKSVIDKTYSLDEIAAAHEHSEQGHASGKIAITI